MDPSFQGFEFLDLANVNDAELDHINNVLYASERGVKYPELPWVEPNYDVAAAAAPPAGYAVPVSHAVPMYLPSVYVNNVTANVSVHHPYLGYHHAVYESPPPLPPQGRGRGRGKLIKRPQDVAAPHGYQPAPAQYVHSHPYNTYYPGHAAAHVAGSPLFLPGHHVPMYPAGMGYAPYHPQPMYAPVDGGGGGQPYGKQFEPQPPEYAPAAAAGHAQLDQHGYREVKDPAVSYTEKGTTHYRLPDVAPPTTNGFSAAHDAAHADEPSEKAPAPDVIVSELKGDAQVFMPARRNVSKLSFTASEPRTEAPAPSHAKPGFVSANQSKPAFAPANENKASAALANQIAPTIASANQITATIATANQNITSVSPTNQNMASVSPANQNTASVSPANQNTASVCPTNQNMATIVGANQKAASVAPANEGRAAAAPANEHKVGFILANGGKPGFIAASEKPGFSAGVKPVEANAADAKAAPVAKPEAPAVAAAAEPEIAEPAAAAEVAPPPASSEPSKPSAEAAESKPSAEAAEAKPSAWGDSGGGGGGKSWASLFRPSAGPKEAEPKQVARVQPFQSPVQSAAEALRAQRMSDDPHLYRLGEFLCHNELDHRAVSLQPRGLTNRGNWCYINSTLQALLACPPFYNLMKSLPMPRANHKSPTPIVDSIVQFVGEFAALSSVSRTNRKERTSRKEDSGSLDVIPGVAFEPTYIYKMLNNIRSDTFKVEGRQEDAEEFLSCLLNALNDEMLEVIKLVQDVEAVPLKEAAAAADALGTDDADQWKVMGPKNKGALTRRAEFARTPVADIFRGNLRSRVQRAGDQSTDNVQPFFTLQLDIEKAGSVREALELLVGRDQLEGVTCTKTNQEVEAWQQVTLDDLPLVLLLHLKWFDYRTDGCTKIVKSVDFPVELKLDPKLLSSTKKYGAKAKQYKLFAVVYHDGKEASKGHYVTDAFHVGCGGWVRYDDSAVRAVTEHQVLHPKSPRVPYLLYYRRGDTIGPQAPAAAAPAAGK